MGGGIPTVYSERQVNTRKKEGSTTFSCTFQAWAKGVGFIDEMRPEWGQGWQVRPGSCDCFVLACLGCVLSEIIVSRGRILGLNPDKSLKSFPSCYSHSFALRLLFVQTHATSYSFYSSVTVHCKGERRKPARKLNYFLTIQNFLKKILLSDLLNDQGGAISNKCLPSTPNI